MGRTAPFAGVTLLSALLLFLVEPLLARRILPWFGGAQSVWTVSLLFYQTMLLAGYLYSHLGRRLGARRQALLHAALLTASLALLPIVVAERWKPDGAAAPAGRLLGLLTTTVAVPYLMLASTAPLVHGWFARLRPGRSPYPLYSLSNAASLVALLAYPGLIEPLLPVSRQSIWWSWGYGLFVLACAALSLAVARVTPAESAHEVETVTPSSLTRGGVALWLGLSTCGSGLLLALTNHMTQDVAAVPFLWVLPLAIYLLTFVLAFAGLYRRGTWGALLVLGLAVMAGLWDVGFALPLVAQIGGSAAVLLVACMVCHGELARAAPPARDLTAFYLTIAAGGALGGALVALAAPALLSDLWELPGFLLLSYALLLVVLRREQATAAVGARVSLAPRSDQRARWIALVLVLVLAIVGFIAPSVGRSHGTLATRRNFYGVLRVQDAPEGILRNQRVLSVGRIFHGGQFIDPARRLTPTAYYALGSGVDHAIRLLPLRLEGKPIRMGVIGLGVGTLAAWGEPGDSIRFYEINPDVDVFARRYFTFLRESRAAVSVALGDGRLSLERELGPSGGSRFDVLVVDAFAGDAVPVHLLTREAAAIYARALEEDGVLAFNVTNRHVDLERVVRGLAAALGLEAVQIRAEPPAGSGGTPSTWMLVTRNEGLLHAVRPFAIAPGETPALLWTDDFSNLLQVLR